MLASLRNYRPNRKKITSKSPFSFKRPDPASPHPYATQVFDIGESSFEEPADSDVVSNASRGGFEPVVAAAPPQLPPVEPVNSPRVEIDIDLTPADWFPSHFLKTDSIAGPSSLTGAATTIAESSNAAKSADTLASAEMASDEEEEEDDEEDYSDASEDNLEDLDASDFLSVPENDETPNQSSSFPRKAAPSPIKIPNASLHGPRVQLVRSATTQSRPESTFSFEGVSAVSGTTIARALIGDSFILSNDRSSKYRSGASVLTRSDSATLPRGEHPFSPAWTIRKSGAFTPVDALGAPIPPVPQMPEGLRRAIAESRDRLKVDDAAGKKNRRRSGSDMETPVTPLSRTNSGSGMSRAGEEEDADKQKRVSRISEATTPVSAVSATPDPSAPDSAANTATASDASPNTSLNFHGAVSPASFPTSPGESTTSASDNRSSRDIDNVLDYYNFEASPGYTGGSGGQSAFDLPSPDPVDPNRFQPAFSPITEETRSQLSPNSFTSRRTNGKLSLASTPSPSTGGGRVEWRGNEIRSLPPHPLLPIGDRPRSSSSLLPAPIVIPPPPLQSISAYAASPLSSTAGDDHLEPPSRGLFHNRQRSGSTPAPIKVVRDSRDITAYNITVTPRVGTSSNGSSPATAEDALARQQQTFPETPSAFSPTFSPSTDASAGDRNSMVPPPVPPSASGVVGPRPGYTSLAQQMLLTRAATTVRGARHSRQASLTRARNRGTAIFPSAETATLLKEAIPNSPEDDTSGTALPASLVEENEEDEERKQGEVDDQTSSQGHAFPSNDAASEADSASVYTPSIQSSYPSPPPPNRSFHRLSKSDDSHWQSIEGRSQDQHEKPHVEKPLPAMPVSPAESLPSQEPAAELAPSPAAPTAVPAALKSASSSSLPRPSHRPSPSVSPAPLPQPPSRRSSYKSTPSPAPPFERTEEAALSSSSTATPAINEPHVATAETTAEPTTPPPPISPRQNRPPLMLSPPPPPVDHSLGSPHIVPVVTPVTRGGDSPTFSSFGSPPPYYTVMYDRDNARDQERMTPSTGGSNGYADNFFPSTPSLPLREQRTSLQSLAPATPGPNGRRARPRPPLPVGPRRPSTSTAALPSQMRNRNGSVSSISSQLPSGRRFTSPRFQTPQPKWRGYTMDAAKWTFSSAQLQGIVSRAIRQSAEASSIRLLRMETVDRDIPAELHRLEMQRTDVKTRYKMLAKRRTNLTAQLTGYIDGTEPEDTANILRAVENLKEISSELDRLAEDLHSADEQIAQLMSLRDVHSASALAMALRKLNASFLKQIAEAESLREQVETLRAERDEAWSQAVDVANDFDDLNERMEVNSPGPSVYSKRSSRVLASKKSSIRVSKAGLRSSSRRSSVSSIGNRASSSGLPSATFEDIPPVPPIPRRRPDDIRTDLSTRVSALATTPTSESRALDQAQAELYSMLGLAVPERNSRRSHSLIMSAASDSENPILSSLAPPAASSRPRSDASRPTSLPPNSHLSEALSAMTADRTAMMVTLGILDD
ncbi:hypothetical protein R3P38DRAFT_3448248 [Favolaschia claudopus]|uniref:Uncharacterized protein n=1 Tax=Favolaschia claudopus TaxID=2862362 RepID=A0AAW0CVD2_9AGAR